VVGAPANEQGGDGKGAVYVFQRSGDDWPLIAGPLRPDSSEAQNFDGFGSAVSLCGHWSAVGTANDVEEHSCRARSRIQAKW
jgi:hypothetical protein